MPVQGQVLSPPPQTSGQKGFYLPRRRAESSPELRPLQSDGPALSSIAGINCLWAGGDGSRRVGALPWPFAGAGPLLALTRGRAVISPAQPLSASSSYSHIPISSSGLTIFRLVQRKAWHSRFSLSWFWAM